MEFYEFNTIAINKTVIHEIIIAFIIKYYNWLFTN